MWLLLPFPVSVCLCFKSLCPRMGISLAQFGFGMGQQGCASQKGALADIARKGAFDKGASCDLTAPRARCCSSPPRYLWGSCCCPFCQSTSSARSLYLPPPWRLCWPGVRTTAVSWSHSASRVSNRARFMYCLTYSALCICVFSSLQPTPRTCIVHCSAEVTVNGGCNWEWN